MNPYLQGEFEDRLNTMGTLNNLLRSCFVVNCVDSKRPTDFASALTVTRDSISKQERLFVPGQISHKRRNPVHLDDFGAARKVAPSSVPS